MQEALLKDFKADLQASNRFHFNKKGNHQQILMEEEPAEEKISATINSAYPIYSGFTRWKVHWYKTENGKISHGIVYFYDLVGNVYKLPISAWELKFPARWQTIAYDMLNVAKPYPLYCLDRIAISTSIGALVCDSEASVEYIYKDHGWISNYIPITTYTSIEETDWNKINGLKPI